MTIVNIHSLAEIGARDMHAIYIFRGGGEGSVCNLNTNIFCPLISLLLGSGCPGRCVKFGFPGYQQRISRALSSDISGYTIYSLSSGERSRLALLVELL